MAEHHHEPNNIEKIRHSLAHLLAAAVLQLWPDTKPTIGPAIDDGFYYDFEFVAPPSLSELSKIEKTMKKILQTWKEFSSREVSAEEARALFFDNPYKLELVEGIIERGEKITLYKSGDFEDLCRGGHVESARDMKPGAFVLSRLAGAYWRGDETKSMLTRIYGYAFSTKEELDAHLLMLEEAKKRDHKKLGKELDLFIFSDIVGKGLPLWTPKGAVIRRELERFIVDEEIRRGYLHVYTPDIAKVELYEKSGHYPHYKDSMYAPIQIDDERFMLRPMTCPHHFELYLSHQHSYRELPIRIAELAKLYRYEQSGELSGLQRVRSFCLADAHIICADEEQAISEIGRALDLIEYATNVFGLVQGNHYWYRLSLGDRDDDKKYFKNDAAWDTGEELLRQLLQKRGCQFVEAPNEAAFYGPKIDIQMKNVNGKEDTAFTVQYDFCMPERFDLTYTAADGAKKRALVVHRSSIGAIERIIAFLIEHYAGAFPIWLAPVQASLLPVGEDFVAVSRTLQEQFVAAGIRCDVRDENESVGYKIRAAAKEKIPYMLVIGEREAPKEGIWNAETPLSVRVRGQEELLQVTLREFLARVTKEIRECS